MKKFTDNIYINNEKEFRLLFSGSQNLGSEIDDQRVGVILEGGALRGVLSCSYAMALKELLPSMHYFSIYGSSSGGLNAVYFATDQLDVARSIYIENATDKRCTNIMRFPNVLNVDWLIDNWLFGTKAFDKAKLRASKSRVYVSLTRMLDGKPMYADVTTSDDKDLNSALKATAYAPLLTNSTGTYNGVEVGDGAIGDALLFDRAVADGCTHIICLYTRQPSYRKGGGSFLSRLFKNLRLAHRSTEYKKAFFEAEARYNDVMERIYSKTNAIPTLIVCPSAANEIPSNIETKADRISNFSEIAYKVAKTQLAMLLP